MKTEKLYRQLASTLAAWDNCIAANNSAWRDNWDEYLDHLVKIHLPSGAGFDTGTTLDRDKSSTQRLVFHTAYHHMNDHGYYDGWTEHQVVVTADLLGIDVRVTGRDRNGIKDFIEEMFYEVLMEKVPTYSEYVLARDSSSQRADNT